MRNGGAAHKLYGAAKYIFLVCGFAAEYKIFGAA